MASPIALSLLLLNALVGSCYAGGFLEVNRASVQAELKGVLDEVLGHGHGVTRERLSKIRGSLQPLFRSLPKNNQGHLSGQVMRYAVRRYFSEEHAWIVKGFEPHAELLNTTEDSQNILKGKVPNFIRTVLEEKFEHNGFALDDVVSMVAAIERLAFDEVVNAVEASFWLNDFSVMDSLSASDMWEVLSSYFITEMFDGATDKKQHKFDKKYINLRYPHWNTTKLFLSDIAGGDSFSRMHRSNPFAGEQRFFFSDLVRMAERVSEQFGPWSNHECTDMKDMLAQKDVHGSGRVRLAEFYKNEGAWQFTEPSEYLRQLGALDESTPSIGPQVLIPNYVTGLSNCITSKSYYSICCLNECDQIYRHVEAASTAPTASPGEIISALDSLPHAPALSDALRGKLEEVGELHKGKVPLHGRLMAQWLHFAFPHECPFPHVSGTIAPKTPTEWRLEVGGERDNVSQDEVKQIIEMDATFKPMEAHESLSSWTHKEFLLEHSTSSDEAVGVWSRWFRIVPQVCMMLSFAFALFWKVGQVGQPNTKKAVEYDV